MKKFTIILTVLIAMTITTNAQWQPTNGPYGEQINCLAISGNNIFAGANGNGGVYLSSDNGNNWNITSLTNYTVRALAISGSNIFAGCYGGGVFLSSNNGSSWAAMNSGLTYIDVEALAMSGSNIFAGTSFPGSVFLSLNNGSSWTEVNNGLPSSPNNLGISSLVISGSNIFAGTGYLGVGNYGVFMSSNNGTSWAAVNNGLTSNALYVNALVINGSNIFAGTEDGVYISSNNGNSWTSKGLSTYSIISLAISGSNIFAGTDGNGVFMSSNNGSSWSATGLTGRSVYSIAINGNYIFAGTDSLVWKRSSVGIEEINNKKSNIAVYPNPASDIITVNIDNANPADLTLNIYNVIGTLVKSETLKQNNRQINIGDLSNGVYMVTIKSKDWTESQRLIIQR